MRKSVNIVIVLLFGLFSIGKCQFPMPNPYYNAPAIGSFQPPTMYPIMMPSLQPNCITYCYPVSTIPVIQTQMLGCGSPSPPPPPPIQSCQPSSSVPPNPPEQPPPPPMEPPPMEPPPSEPPPAPPAETPVDPPATPAEPPMDPPAPPAETPADPPAPPAEPPVDPPAPPAEPPVDPPAPPAEPPVDPPAPPAEPPVDPPAPPAEPPVDSPAPPAEPPVDPPAPPAEPPVDPPAPPAEPPVDPPAPPAEPPVDPPAPPAEPPVEPITSPPQETDLTVEAPVTESPPGSSSLETNLETSPGEPDVKPIGTGCGAVYPVPSLTECQLLSSEAEKCVSNSKCAYCLDRTSKVKCDSYENTIVNCLDMYSPYGPNITINSDNEVSLTEIPMMASTRKNITVTIDLNEIPLDFYYLMDFTGSFHDDKANLVTKSPALLEEVKNLSPDFNIGFGAFKDKPVGPFGGISDYSFWNKLSLTKDPSTFTSTINDTIVSGGADGPEGILDALFQASVCEEQIGWRMNSRRFLLVTTDAPPHMAGEGLSKGLTPFDGKCHLNDEGRYTQDAVLDYPSIQQLKEIVEKNKITLIFAVTARTFETYNNISKEIKGSAVITLDNDSGNIIEVVKKAYADATEFVQLETAGLPDNMEVSYYSECNGDEEKQTNICEIPTDGLLTFIVELEMKTCPVPGGSNIPLVINPIGLTNSVSINIAPVCD